MPFVKDVLDKEVYILLVEDDIDDQEFIMECFINQKMEHQVKIVSSGDQLFDVLDHTPDNALLPTLIILDYNLPGLTGEAILVLLKKDPRYWHIPVIIYSTGMNHEKELDLLGFGANFCRIKPSTVNGLNYMIGEFIGFAKSSFQQHR